MKPSRRWWHARCVHRRCRVAQSGAALGTSALPHLHGDWAHPCHIAVSANAADGPHDDDLDGKPIYRYPGLKMDPTTYYSSQCPLTPQRPHWDSARPAHICAGTGLAPPTSAPGLGSPLPHLHRDWAHFCHICARTGLTPATSAPGLAGLSAQCRPTVLGLSLWSARLQSSALGEGTSTISAWMPAWRGGPLRCFSTRHTLLMCRCPRCSGMSG